MGKKKATIKPPEELTILYDLYELPSAQHKAGLAGLLVLIDSLRRRKLEPLPEIVDGPTATNVTLKFTPKALKTAYDEFFAPIVKNVPDSTKKGKTKQKEFPKGQFLETLGIPPSWLTIWQEVIRNVIRAGAPAQFKPYRDRAAKAKKPKKWDWEQTWAELLKDKQTSLSASDYLGAESTTADGVPFRDHAKYALLLTFAPVVSLPYLSQTLKRVSKSSDNVYRFQRNAYVVVTPEVSDLRAFTSEYPNHLADLNADTLGNSRYPKEALVSVPEEGGLEFLASHRVTAGNSEKFLTADCVSNVMITHLDYGKGSPHLQHIGVVRGTQYMLNEYVLLREQCWNYLYRELRLRNLLGGSPWYTGADQLFAEQPAEAFIHQNASPRPYFGKDIQKTFRAIRQDLALTKGDPRMLEDWPDKDLADRVFRITQAYVNRRTENRCDGMTWDDYQAKKGNPQKYREAREKVCLDAFLALRGRDDAELASYFVGTLCSVPQNLNSQQFQNVSQQLLTDEGRIKIKTLAMLALSAHSYFWEAESKDSEGKKGNRSS